MSQNKAHRSATELQLICDCGQGKPDASAHSGIRSNYKSEKTNGTFL